MRLFTALLCLLAYQPALSDNVQKWTDAAGKIHYGDAPPPTDATHQQLIELHSNFDELAYEAGIKRNSDLYRQIKQIEKREEKEKKKAEKDLNDYYKYLDKKEKSLDRTKKRRNKAREKERRSTSIKVTRSKTPAPEKVKGTGYKF